MSAYCVMKTKGAMPRGSRSQGNSFASRLQGNGQTRYSGSAAMGSKAKPHKKQEDAQTHCPLCIEKFDATEQEFKPCPCGYKICLFCYDRITKEFNNLCPGCRAPYGSKDASSRSVTAQNTSTTNSKPAHSTRTASSTTSSSSSSTPGAPAVPKRPKNQGHAPHTGRGHLQPKSQSLPVQSQRSQQNRQTSQTLSSRPPPSTSTSSWPSLAESTPAPQATPQPKPPPKPSGGIVQHQSGSSAATDVTASSGDLANVDTSDGTGVSKSESVASESQEWPALKSSANRPGGQQQQQQHQHQNGEVHGPLRNSRSGSIDLSSSVEAGSALGSASLVTPLRSQPKQGHQGMVTAEVVSVAAGVRKTVCVPIDFSNLPGCERDEDGMASLQRTKKLVQDGKISSTEGAVRLISVLNQLEKKAGERIKPADLKKSRESNMQKKTSMHGGGSGSGSDSWVGDQVGAKTPSHHRSIPSLSHWGISPTDKGPERLEDTPSVVVDQPPVNASPISPPSSGSSPFVPRPNITFSPHSEKQDNFHQTPPGLPKQPMASVSMQLGQGQSLQQNGQHSLWTDRGLPGIELQARQNLSTKLATGISQHLSLGGGLAGSLGLSQDGFKMSDPPADTGFDFRAVTSLDAQRRVQSNDLGFRFQQPSGPITIPTQQELNESMMGLGSKEPSTGQAAGRFGLSDLQYLNGGPGGAAGGRGTSHNAPPGMLASSPNFMSTSPGMLSGSPGLVNGGSPGMMIGSPGMWMGGHQPEIPQYLPPDIAAARGLGGLTRSPQNVPPPGMYRPFPVQNIPQQFANIRLQDPTPGNPAASRLLHNWK